MQINVSDRGAMLLAAAGSIVAAFAIAPDAAMGFVEQLLAAFGGGA